MLGLYPIPGAGDEAVVLTKDGYLWRVSLRDAFEPASFGDLSGQLLSGGSEEGLLGLTFSPQYGTDGRVYIYYNAPPSSPAFYARDVLSRFQVAGNTLDLSSEEVLIDLDDPGLWHNGGQLEFGADGYLYLSIGDGGWRNNVWYWDNAQDLTDMFGDIIRIDVSGESGYSIPPDNPFIDGPGGNADEIWAMGFRNPWRFSFDNITGDLWVGDVGQWRWEEVGRAVMGRNHGWPVMEGFTCFNKTDPNDCDQSPYVLPRASYCHDEYLPGCPTVAECAVVGGFVYRGSAMLDLYGWYVYGDFCSGRIWALDTSSETSEPITLTDSPYLISSFAELPNGELLVLTLDNAIYRLTSDGDGDLISNVAEFACGSDAASAASLPERIDGAFVDADDDGDTQVDEPLPVGAEAYDCDGDGFAGTRESSIGTNDQDPCGNNGWPADLADAHNALNIGDYNSFLFPLRGDGSLNKFGHAVPDVNDPNLARWDLDANNVVSIGDLNALNPAVRASTARPPMFGGLPAFFTNGGQCPWP
jgi:glucose/arabinose dehydrogenase